jgi:hypothetical protein
MGLGGHPQLIHGSHMGIPNMGPYGALLIGWVKWHFGKKGLNWTMTVPRTQDA